MCCYISDFFRIGLVARLSSSAVEIFIISIVGSRTVQAV